MIDWVYDFGIVQWLVFFALVGYIVLWVSGWKGLNDVEERVFRIEAMDAFMFSEFGFVLLFLRNLVVAIFLVLMLFITT